MVSYYSKEFPDYGKFEFRFPEGFKDTSWHNDAMPSMEDADCRLRIWFDYANPERRENTGWPRFAIYKLVPFDPSDTEHPEDLICDETALLNTEDWKEVLAFLATYEA